MLAEISWPIIERIHIAGDFAVSPHGIFVALGFLAGAQLMLKRAEVRGVARRRVDNVPDVISAIVTRAAIGGILGARIFFVLTRPSEFDLVSALQVWNGGLSLLGGIAGGVILAVPYIVKHKLSLPLLLDSLAPGLALGIFVGRIGDLIIGEHLGDRTDFFLGWRCSGQVVRDLGYIGPDPFTGPQVQGCFDTAVHQTALYDFLTGLVVFLLLIALERRSRFDGFFGMTFGLAYGGGRFLTDFARAADKDLIGPLTGTQITGIGLVVTGIVWALVTKPWTTTPYAWVPGERPEWTRPRPAAETADGTDDGTDQETGDGADTVDVTAGGPSGESDADTVESDQG